MNFAFLLLFQAQRPHGGPTALPIFPFGQPTVGVSHAGMMVADIEAGSYGSRGGGGSYGEGGD
jgi:hypothetical protein